MAALDGCTKSRDRSLCEEVLRFTRFGGSYPELVEKNRAAVEAVLRSAGGELLGPR